MKPRVILVRPRRTYSDDGKEPSRTEAEPAARTVEVNKKSSGKGRVNYPSIEGVIINPLPGPGGQEEEKKQGVEHVLSLALALPPSEQKILLARLALSQQAQKPGDRELEMWAVGVQTALAGVSGGEAGAAQGVMLIRRSLAASSCWAPVTDFMERAGFAGLEVSKRQSVYLMLADLLVKYAAAVSRKVSAPLTAKFVANNAQHIAAIFDNAFPGYVAAGLAPMVAARLVAPRPS
jgi:hypothetical protein